MAHEHKHENTRDIVNRLSRAIGHLEAVRRMVEEDRDCGDVLIQLAAVRAAINRAGQALLQDHISHCVREAMENGDEEAILKLNRAIEQFLK